MARKDWSEAARVLGLDVVGHGFLTGIVEGVVIEVMLHGGEETSTEIRVTLPRGPLYDPFLIRPRRAGGHRSHQWRTKRGFDRRIVETGHPAFDRSFAVLYKGERGTSKWRVDEAKRWVGTFLSARRRQALLDLHATIGRFTLRTGLRTEPAFSIVTTKNGERRADWVIDRVRAMVTCAQELKAGLWSEDPTRD